MTRLAPLVVCVAFAALGGCVAEEDLDTQFVADRPADCRYEGRGSYCGCLSVEYAYNNETGSWEVYNETFVPNVAEANCRSNTDPGSGQTEELQKLYFSR